MPAPALKPSPLRTALYAIAATYSRTVRYSAPAIAPNDVAKSNRAEWARSTVALSNLLTVSSLTRWA